MVNWPFGTWTKIASAAMLASGIALSAPAQASVILTFGQTSNASTITAKINIAKTKTTITGTNVRVSISQYAGGGTPIDAFLNLNLASDGAATAFSGQIFQSYSGSASFTSLSGDRGIDYLTADFTDVLFGTSGASSLTLSASEPPGTVSFTSDILPANELNDPRALSFAFADVTPKAAIVGTTLRGFKSSVSGTVSAATTPVPEPTTLALMGAGLFGLAMVQRRRGARS